MSLGEIGQIRSCMLWRCCLKTLWLQTIGKPILTQMKEKEFSARVNTAPQIIERLMYTNIDY